MLFPYWRLLPTEELKEVAIPSDKSHTEGRILYKQPQSGLPFNTLEIEFSTSNLERCYDDISEATREWGPVVARNYVSKINRIYAMDTFNDLYQHRGLRLHRLHGEYAGKFAITLTGRYRLIIGRGNTDVHLVIYEVSNHYDD